MITNHNFVIDDEFYRLRFGKLLHYKKCKVRYARNGIYAYIIKGSKVSTLECNKHKPQKTKQMYVRDSDRDKLIHFFVDKIDMFKYVRTLDKPLSPQLKEEIDNSFENYPERWI